MPTLSTPQPARHPAPTVQAQRLAYLIFERPDLDEALRFLTDFGLSEASRDEQTLFLRGTGSAPFCYVVQRGESPRFSGFGLTVGSRDDLARLAALSGATTLSRSTWPGGGDMVALTDPSGFTVHAICGQQSVEPLAHRAPLVVNAPDSILRVNAGQRDPAQPPEVIRLGHLALGVADYQATSAWYTQHFGFIPSDVQVLPDGSPAVAFMRLDLGAVPADHHTLAIAQSFVAELNHAAFEVVDPDAVGMGQRVLRERGWKHAWGIGRHILGSQIFDYWEDAWGDRHEHYCDGDRFTASEPTGVHAASRESMAQWGQAMPASFTRPNPSWANIKALLHSLRHSPDVTVAKMITLMRTFG